MTAVRNVWAIFLRELGGYFLAPIAYVVIFLFLVTHGTIFWLSARSFTNRPPEISSMLEDLFGFALYWIIPLSPLLTMRLFAEEKRTGILEMLMTAPVTESQVVLGKFLAAQAFYTLIWLSLMPLLVILALLGRPDWGPILAIYLAGYLLVFLLTVPGAPHQFPGCARLRDDAEPARGGGPWPHRQLAFFPGEPTSSPLSRRARLQEVYQLR